ncbi:restriction endonuclease [Streptomyces sp. NPDC048172]|uniref:restriction endonuclease n=1 Tax=Streptomyces sp. NPDC048172 TaxID=3365505 RepID=UPI00371CDE53
MAKKRTRRRSGSAVRRRRRRNAYLGLWALAVFLVMANRSWLWPVLLALVAVLGVVLPVVVRLRRTGRLPPLGVRPDAVSAGRRSLAEVDAMSWREFEHYVADLCRRDGCTDVEVTGGSGDLGADVTARLPDGRRLVVQCKHYAPHRYVPSGDMQKFVGTAWLHHRADVAVFAATCAFSRAALDYAVQQRVVAVHRDLLGQWSNGTPLRSLLPLNGAGQGDRAHRRRWRDTYGR